ncbi:Ig-like domain-containing protein, partial [Macellibacteroides fermentans]|uniref:Ig-like domain-containing protein n=1 Tax=Macellibacteroides fermentans TaxID=879969 RepID=UPI00406BE400
KRTDYKLSVNNIADQRKVANVMDRPVTKVYKAVAEDNKAPKWETITVLSPTTILVEFSDESKIDEDSALDLYNYELKGLEIESIRTIKNVWKTFRAILTVEEMETGKTYDLTIVDILDEFGNAMGETSKSAKAISGNLAAAKLDSAVATGKNAVTLTFDKEVDEKTAENLGNYTIDEQVGAPTKATLQADNKTVKLEVNDLINGYGEYDVIVDGVEDLAGNKLYYKMKVNTTTNVWDTKAPELEDADIISSKVVALSFNERVEFEAGAKLVLAVNGVNDDATNVMLAAKGYADENTVVEFSSAAALDVSNNYTVVAVVYGDSNTDGGVKDLIGNRVLESSISFGDFTFEGIDDELDAAEVDSYEQVNGKTFEVTMSKYVDFTGADAANVGGFTVTIDKDVVTFTKNDGKIIEDTDYEFNFADFLADKHGNPVENADDDDLTILTGEYTDEDAPYVEEVVAKDRYTVEITFSEDIPVMDAAAKTAFLNGLKLKNYDLDSSISVSMDANDSVSDNDGDNVIRITLAKPMEARYEYELTIGKGAFKDFVGIANEDEDTFYFDGTNLAK